MTFTDVMKRHVEKDDITWVKKHMKARNLEDEYYENPLHRACCFVSLECIRYFVKLGYDVNEEDLCTYPLHYLIVNVKELTPAIISVIKLLVSHGANPNVRDTEAGETVMDIVRDRHPDEIEKYRDLLLG